ncbi:hypothetical protein GCK72_003572 [Caenorhabditis remanei]|uniref:Uncharacterized protein n=1 Tax=Caenorhabditis remanei TaxID=31234 RepID=A0A6A5HXL4_CAERE|nr:hypothetical protein GCK72_003572 [Caenorhabditis remanei]KAF1771744.1 hypothetical protein GCK72_003572 [Caenorhabditis remanei]
MAPPAKRKLNFDTPPGDVTLNFETDVNFPKEWKIDGVNIEERIQKLREELREQGVNPVQNAIVDPRSKFRTEYRRILTAHAIITDAIRLNDKKISWFKNATEMMANDIDALHNRREHVDKSVEDFKKELSRLDASVGVLKSQQIAVKSVLELREDEYMGGADDFDSNLPDEYQKFGKISKLCEVALKSYDDIKKRNEEMQKYLMTEKNRQRKQREAMMNLMEEKERQRVEELDEVFKDFTLEQLKELRDNMRIARSKN